MDDCGSSGQLPGVVVSGFDCRAVKLERRACTLSKALPRIKEEAVKI